MPIDDAGREPGIWSLSSRAIRDGVRIELAVPSRGIQGAAIDLTREEARGFARDLLSAAGDGMERTFPKPADAPDE